MGDIDALGAAVGELEALLPISLAKCLGSIKLMFCSVEELPIKD